MIRNGTKPNKESHKDFDLHKSFGNVGAPTPQFPAEYITDSGLTMPDQNTFDTSFVPPVPPEPEGCTNECSADITTDQTGIVHRPDVLEEITHANALGGFAVRTSLDMAKNKLNWFGTYFAVKAYAPLDYFDAIRLAISSGYPEKRSVSLGTPWPLLFESTGPDGIVPHPQTFNLAGVPWHNHKIAGWKTINGIPYLVSKSWQGPNFGDKGFCYFDRALINSLMAINGTCAFTVTQVVPPSIQTIDMGVVRWLLSLIGLRY